MFRNSAPRALLLAALGLAFPPACGAQAGPSAGSGEPSADGSERTYAEMLSTGTDPWADARRIARELADRWEDDGAGAWYFVDGTGAEAVFDEPAFAFVAPVPDSMDGAVAALSSVLAALEGLAAAPPENDVAFLVAPEGDPSLTAPGGARLDPGASSVVVLLPPGPSGEPAARLLAGASGLLSPRPLLEATRSACRAAGLPWRESPVEDFFALLGLIPGEATLAPWLRAGFSAIAMRAPPSLAVLLASSPGLDGPRGHDRNYFRYPAPWGSVTMGDTLIVLVGCLAGSALALYALMNPRRHESLREAAAASAVMALALISSIGLASLASLVAGAVFGTSDMHDTGRLSPALRLAGLWCLYFGFSGFASRLGLMRDRARLSGMHAGAALFVAAALAGLALAPAAIPFCCLFAVLILAGGRTVGTAALALAAALAAGAPFLLPLLAGRYPEGVSALLNPSPAAFVAQTLVLSPFALWIGATASPGARLRRGRRSASFFLALGAGFAVAEALAARL